jgi:carotenoid cleavage dioxygenase
VINAWEEGETVVLTGCRIADPLVGDPRNPHTEGVVPALGNLRLAPVFHRWTLDLATGQAKEEMLDDTFTEFPRMNDARLGRPNRYSYHPRLAREQTLLFDGLIRYDLETGKTASHDYPRGWYGGEVSFAASGAGSGAEDELFVLDARDVAAPPLARIRIPQRVPTGYHTRWVPAAELLRQRPLR